MFTMNNVQKGFTVYSFDGDKVGTIGDVAGQYFKTDTGFLGLGKDFYVPFTAIDHVDGDRVYLNVTKDRFNQMAWDRQPAGWMR
jgi:hypothetical protein